MKRQSLRRLILLVSLLLFPVTLYYFSPYLIINGGLAGTLTGSAIVFAALFFSSLIFGRAFCGWVCPAGSLQEYAAQINPRQTSSKINWLKYAIWVPWIIAIAAAFISAGGIKGVDFFFMTHQGISASDLPGYYMYFTIVGLFLILPLIFGKRFVCHAFCWMAPFMVLGTKLKALLGYPSLHLEAQAEACTHCQLCNRKCSMSLDVEAMVKNHSMADVECILCGECVDACPRKVIQFRYRQASPVKK